MLASCVFGVHELVSALDRVQKRAFGASGRFGQAFELAFS